ncbi:hypothetical protein [uncultured Anaerofustis sp.]|uniref:hypothetical protein n=1 Tax=uncultured Anaerofustis sp. TaxID=904996 RepID=UPI0025E8BF34|nr:hypothetical protein [uncultured Anaerofustis sp.]
MDKKTEKKINQKIRQLEMRVGEVIKLRKELKAESAEKKLLKLNKKINKSIRMIQYYYNEVKELGGNTEDIINGLNVEQREIIKEIFPAGTDENAVEAKKIIDDIKEKIELVKKRKQTITYNSNEDIEIKRKNKLFMDYADVGRYVVNTGDERVSDYYNEYWQYDRDYEMTKDKYFSTDEQDIIKEGIKCFREYQVYYREKHKFLINLGEKIVDSSSEKLYETKLKQAKLWADNLYQDVFPEVVKLSNPNVSFTDEELIKEAIEMSKRYINYLGSENKQQELRKIKNECMDEANKVIAELKNQGNDVKAEVNNVLAKFITNRIGNAIMDIEKDKEIIAFDIMREKVGFEKAYFINAFDNDKIIDKRREYLTSYSLEELGL